MIRTQIQLPEPVYRRAKRLAEAKSMSLAELARRGIEYMLCQYPTPERVSSDWEAPRARRPVGWRGVSPARLKELAQRTALEDDQESR